MVSSRHLSRPAGQDGNSITQPDRLADVVGDEQDGESTGGPEPLQLVVEDVAGHGVERAEWLVHQQDLGALGKGARDGGPLLHAARQLVRTLVTPALELNHVQQLVRAGVAFAARHSGQPQGKVDVLGDREPRKERRLLEEECDPPSGFDRSELSLVEAGKDVEERALAAAGGTDQTDEFALFDAE